MQHLLYPDTNCPHDNTHLCMQAMLQNLVNSLTAMVITNQLQVIGQEHSVHVALGLQQL